MQPPAYSRLYSLVQDALDTPAAPFNSAHVDAELDGIEDTLDATLANLALIQRDDGALKNAAVHPDSLSTATKALIAATWTPRGLWVTATAYVVGDVVQEDVSSYVCSELHTSGTFATDLAAGKWVLLGSTSPILASTITFSPYSSIAASEVQAALEELIDLAESAVQAATLANSSDAAEGAVLVGLYDGLAPTYLKTTSDILNGLPVSILRFIDKAAVTHSSLQDGTNAVDLADNLNEAVQALSTSRGGGSLFLPWRGPYLCESDFTVLSKVRITGDGKDVTTIKRTATGGPVLLLQQAIAGGPTGTNIEGIKLWHTGTASTDHALSWIRVANSGPNHATFKDLLLTGYNGLNMEGDDTSSAIWNTFLNVKAASCVNHGFRFKGVSNQNTLINCAAHDSGKNGCHIEKGTSSGAQNVTFINFAGERSGLASGAAAYGLYARGVHGLNVIGGYFEENGPDTDFGAGLSLNSAGMWVQDCKAVDVRGGTFNKSNYGILATNSNVTIENDTFYEFGTWTNRKYSIGFQTNCRIRLGINYTPSAVAPFLNNVDSDVKALTGYQEQVLAGNDWAFTLANRKVIAASDPSAVTAAVGDIVMNTANTSGGVLAWMQLSSGVWRPFAQNVRISTTANRPTLRAQDIGVMFMDTTLDADGKPIWWNGTAWVDATGAVV